ncbi:hypothetical protein G7Y89_g14878 [Cudoniella acicularis]|uniref:SNF2 N-terminal domain-containing protein n=1 Tax=Cudoniella acicularis TaxID=354080 RepID=A0A8H4QVR9_9HELO|nr:hypothetical protein G7Y89_g14878 [Cudoniella acicularis]
MRRQLRRPASALAAATNSSRANTRQSARTRGSSGQAAQSTQAPAPGSQAVTNDIVPSGGEAESMNVGDEDVLMGDNNDDEIDEKDDGSSRVVETGPDEEPPPKRRRVTREDGSSALPVTNPNAESSANVNTNSTTEPRATSKTKSTKSTSLIAAGKATNATNNSAPGDVSGLDGFNGEELLEEEDLTPTQIAKKIFSKEDKTSKDNFVNVNGIVEKSPPIADIRSAFQHLCEKLLRHKNRDFVNYLEHFGKKKLTVATMCSGTESPILALDMVGKILGEDGQPFRIDHQLSAEIVPYKQAYIDLNFNPALIMQDMTEFFKLRDAPTNDLEEFKRNFQVTTAFGGKSIVPGNVDLLIVGTCCVDWSILNSRQKKITDGGESADTFYAMVEYAKAYRPKLILIENVVSAPWTTSIKNPKSFTDALGNIGYATAVIKLDTKDYYIPQTRRRGYMLCVDLQGREEDEEWVKAIAEKLQEWIKLVAYLKASASAPAGLWIFNADDPRLFSTTGANSIEAIKIKKATAWEKCRVGHQLYRHKLSLGKKRTLTSWENDGSWISPDYFLRSPTGFVERVLDTLEIAHLRNARRGFDDRYFERFIELSQSSFRITDLTKRGIVGCLTPSGAPFSTTRGSKFDGVETMYLQGIPTEQLNLTRLGQAQLQDMAGNAMTSTVAGAVVLSAVAIFRDLFEFNSNSLGEDEGNSVKAISGSNELQEVIRSPVSHEKMSVTKALAHAQLTRRLCYCEGRTNMKDAKFKRCSKCLHTACRSCAKSPKHSYVPVPATFTQPREDPICFESLLRQSLPMEIRLSNLSQEDIINELDQIYTKHHADIDDRVWENIRERIQNTLRSTVFCKNMRRAEYWEVIYESPAARLVLTISETAVRWDLYANVSSEPLGSDVGKYLREFPIARMEPSGEDLTKGFWKFWLPKTRQHDATITSYGGIQKTYLNHIGLLDHANTYNLTNVRVDISESKMQYFEEDIRGEYESSPQCGQAYNSLHVKKDTVGLANPLFLYYEQPGRGGDFADFHFLFTKDARRLEKLQHRDSIGRAANTFRLPVAREEKGVYTFEGSEESVTANDLPNFALANQVKISTTGRWITFNSVSGSTNSVVDSTKVVIDFNSGGYEPQVFYHQLPADISKMLPESCGQLFHVFDCTADLRNKLYDKWATNRWVEIDAATEPRFYSQISCILLRGSVLKGHSELDDRWHSICTNGDSRCQKCAPLPAKLTWSWNGKVGKQLPFEDPQDASDFERSMKARPAPFKTFYRINSDDKLEFFVSIDPVALAHRAVAKLDVKDSAYPDDIGKVSTSWRLVTDSISVPKGKFEALVLKNNDIEDDEIVIQSSGLVDPERPDGCPLRLDQRKALTWMLNQEQHPKPFEEREVVEACIGGLGYRLEGQATREVTVRGGVMAFDVGFGKTIVTLATILMTLKAAMKHATEPINGTIPTQATLVLVPCHLPDQWESEIEKFTGMTKASGDIIVVKTIVNLRNATVAQFKAAKIVIFNINILENASYKVELAKFTGLVDIDDKATPRAKAEWQKMAVVRTHENVDKLHQNPDQFASQLSQEYNRNLQETAKPRPQKPQKPRP